MRQMSTIWLSVFVAMIETAICSPTHAQFGAGGPAKKPTVASDNRPAAVKQDAADICQCVGEGDSTARHRIEQALAGSLQSAGLDFNDVPLQDVVMQLQTDYGIPIQIDHPALDDAGVASDASVTRNVHNVSLESGLRLLLKPLQLTYIIENEVLLITTRQEAESHIKICVYDARKVIPDANEKNLKTLVDTIKSCVATGTWAENGGGNAEIRALPNGLIVVSQTQEVHNELQNLMNTLRRMSPSHSTEPRATTTPNATEEPKREPTPAEIPAEQKPAEKPTVQ